jgi:hypothetical protein
VTHKHTHTHTHTHTLSVSHTQTRGKSLLYEETARRRDLDLTTQNIKRKTNDHPCPKAGSFFVCVNVTYIYRPAIEAKERPKTHALERAATVLGDT